MTDRDRDMQHDDDRRDEIDREPRESSGRAPGDGHGDGRGYGKTADGNAGEAADRDAGRDAGRDSERDADPDGDPDADSDAAQRASSEGSDPERPEVAELAELRDRHLRLGAEFENFRKRTREEMGAVTARAKAALIGSLLDVFDDFDRMQQVDPETSTAESVLEGVALVDRKLHRVLAEAGLEIIDPVGAAFDPERMEAVVRVPTDDPEQDDVVDQVLQRGALFKGHLVRPARVAVRKVD